MSNGYSILDTGYSCSVGGNSLSVIPVKTGIQVPVILSEAKDLALRNENCVVAKKMNGIPADTTLEAARKEFEVLRKLGPQVRARMTFEMSDNLRRIVEAGVRHRHPEFDQKKIRLEVLRLIIGDKLARVIASEAKQSQWRR